MKRNLLIFLAIITMLSAVSCNLAKPKKYQGSFLVLFNTVTEVVAFANSESEFEEFTKLIYDNLKEYHELYDKYNDYDGVNNIKTINDNAGITPVKVDQRIIDMLLYSKDMYERTDGTVNIAMGPVLEIWHDYRTAGIDDPINAMLPPIEDLIAANAYTDINQLIINEEESTVYLADEHMSLDVGAIAKGYATEQVTQIAIEQGYSNFLLSVGGNTRAAGTKGKDQELWNVGIQNPDKSSPQSSIYIMELTDMSLVASGDYERYYTVDGIKYHHIIDPNTLMPSEYFTAVSVLCPDSGMADALSTAIYNMPYEKGKEFIDSLDNTEALWILPNGEMLYSDNFKDYIKMGSE